MSKSARAARQAAASAAVVAEVPVVAPVASEPEPTTFTPLAGVSVGGYSTPSAAAPMAAGWASVGVAGGEQLFTAGASRPVAAVGKRAEGEVLAPTLQAPGGQTEYTLLGHSLSAVCRWLGAHHITPKQAERAVRKWLGEANFSGHTIRTQLQHGRHGRHGLPQLAEADAAELLAAARGL